jgi:hypothetical protein
VPIDQSVAGNRFRESTPKPRVFVSAAPEIDFVRTGDHRRRGIRSHLIQLLRDSGLEPQVYAEAGQEHHAAPYIAAAGKIMKSCQGAIILGLAHRGFLEDPFLGSLKEMTTMVGEFNHIDGALSLHHDLPTLILEEEGVEPGGIVSDGERRERCRIPKRANADWLKSPPFKRFFDPWVEKVKSRPQVFLAYRKAGGMVLEAVIGALKSLGAPFLDWTEQLRPGEPVQERIADAARKCRCAILLNTEGGKGGLPPGHQDSADNINLLVGYLTYALGRERCLIIRDKGLRAPPGVPGGLSWEIQDPTTELGEREAFSERLLGFLTNALGGSSTGADGNRGGSPRRG